MVPALDILAGPLAQQIIRERGLRAEDVDVVPAASGGPKWLVLSGLDRVLWGDFFRAPRTRALHVVGSSIGSWRLACLPQRDPAAAIARFEEAYIEQRYAADPPPSVVSATSAGIVDVLLGETGAAEVVDHPWIRLHVLATLCLGLLSSERRPLLWSGLLFAAGANALHRRSLGLQMRRAVVHNAGPGSPFAALRDLPTVQATLTRENLRAALLASGAIPLLMSGVAIPGAPAGLYRDGGVLDYHVDLDFGPGDGLVFYPHFYPTVTPGWFDRWAPWRRARARNWQRAVILAPSADFVSRLPGGRIPERSDFYRTDAERIAAWRTACTASAQLGHELFELLATGRAAQRLRPLA